MRPLRPLRYLAVLAAVFAGAAFAQTEKPRNLMPLPAVPPAPPEIVPFDESLEPEVVIRRTETETIEEYRRDGRLRAIKVTPSHGVPYYLVDIEGDGNFSRMEAFDERIRVPMWVIHKF